MPRSQCLPSTLINNMLSMRLTISVRCMPKMVLQKVFYSLTIGLIVLSAGCAGLGNKTVNITEAQIQQKLNERLSVPFSLLKIFDMNLSNALVTFDKTTGRMHTTFNTHLSSTLLEEAYDGKLALSGKLRFDAPTQAVILDEAEIEHFELDGMQAKQTEMLNALAKKLGSQMLNGLPLYTVKPQDLTIGNTHYQPKDLLVTDQGLQITLTPQR